MSARIEQLLLRFLVLPHCGFQQVGQSVPSRLVFSAEIIHTCDSQSGNLGQSWRLGCVDFNENLAGESSTSVLHWGCGLLRAPRKVGFLGWAFQWAVLSTDDFHRSSPGMQVRCNRRNRHLSRVNDTFSRVEFRRRPRLHFRDQYARLRTRQAKATGDSQRSHVQH